MHKIVIIGGGFAGIRCALDLAKQNITGSKIQIISGRPYFEYHASLYRVVTGRTPLGACIRLEEIFAGKNVEVAQDRIEHIDAQSRTLRGASGSRYSYDYLVLAVGSETAYFDIPGLKELCFRFASLREALRLKRHLHELFSGCEKATAEQKMCSLHFVIVGGGASGVEIAGELAAYTKQLAEKHKLEPSLITIDLIEAGPRLVAVLPPDVSEKITQRLRSLGVNIFLNRAIVKEEVESVYLKDMEMKTKTVVWAAGVKPSSLCRETSVFQQDKKGRVLVDDCLRARSYENVFVLGDAASTPYSGMAQTALHDGIYAAEAISRHIAGKKLRPYLPEKPKYAVPVGHNWAAVILDGVRLYGLSGWWLRRLADLRFFLSVLPPLKAWSMFRGSRDLCENCGICLTHNSQLITNNKKGRSLKSSPC